MEGQRGLPHTNLPPPPGGAQPLCPWINMSNIPTSDLAWPAAGYRASLDGYRESEEGERHTPAHTVCVWGGERERERERACERRIERVTLSDRAWPAAGDRSFI